MAADKHRVLVVGAGSIGERHARCFLATDRAQVGICEVNEATRERVAANYDLVGAYRDIDEALAQSWDVVLVATPANTHIPIARRAVERGAAILIEKPLAVDLEGVEELRDAVRMRGVVAAVSYNYRAHPGLRAMKSCLESGELGRPLQVLSHAGQDFAFYRPAYRDTYFASHETGGGAVLDALTHHVNLGEWFAGPITRISADAAHQRLEGVEVEDTVSVMARHGDVLAAYTLNLYQAPNEVIMTVVCEQGTVRFELHKSRLRVMLGRKEAWADEAHELADRDSWYVLNAHAFLDAFEGKCAPLCSLDEGIQTLRSICAVKRSLQEPSWSVVEHGTECKQ